MLQDNQKPLNLLSTRLVQDMKTQWNSSFDVVSIYTEHQSAVLATLANRNVKKNLKDIATLSDIDLSQAEELIEVLRPIKTVTTIM